MRKLAGIVVCAVLIISFAGCGKKEDNKLQLQSSRETNESAAAVRQREPESKSEQKAESKTSVYTIKIDGDEYNFPMSYEEFKSYGWTYYIPEKDDVSMWPGGLGRHMSGPGMFYDKGDIKCLEFVFYNPSEEAAKFDQCQVIGINVNYGQTIEGRDAEQFIKIPAGTITVNDLAIGVATKEEVHESLGKDWSQENQKNSDYRQWNTLVYYLTDTPGSDYMTITFDDNGIFYEMGYCNNN